MAPFDREQWTTQVRDQQRDGDEMGWDRQYARVRDDKGAEVWASQDGISGRRSIHIHDALGGLFAAEEVWEGCPNCPNCPNCSKTPAKHADGEVRYISGHSASANVSRMVERQLLRLHGRPPITMHPGCKKLSMSASVARDRFFCSHPKKKDSRSFPFVYDSSAWILCVGGRRLVACAGWILPYGPW